MDIIVPDPRINPLPVYAPAGGIVVDIVQHHTRFGNDYSFAPYLNYLTIKIENSDEFYQLCHIGTNSSHLIEGDKVIEGAKIATTGVNGWMTDVRHLHFLVAKIDPKSIDGFRSLKVRFSSFHQT